MSKIYPIGHTDGTTHIRIFEKVKSKIVLQGVFWTEKMELEQNELAQAAKNHPVKKLNEARYFATLQTTQKESIHSPSGNTLTPNPHTLKINKPVQWKI